MPFVPSRAKLLLLGKHICSKATLEANVLSGRCLRGANSARWLATATEPTSKSTPLPHSINATSKPAISRIVDDISSLTLLQAVDLVTELKVNIVKLETALIT